MQVAQEERWVWDYLQVKSFLSARTVLTCTYSCEKVKRKRKRGEGEGEREKEKGEGRGSKEKERRRGRKGVRHRRLSMRHHSTQVLQMNCALFRITVLTTCIY